MSEQKEKIKQYREMQKHIERIEICDYLFASITPTTKSIVKPDEYDEVLEIFRIIENRYALFEQGLKKEILEGSI